MSIMMFLPDVVLFYPWGILSFDSKSQQRRV